MHSITKILLLRFEVQPDCSVELSPSGLKFLKDIFKKYDKVSLCSTFFIFVIEKIILFKDGDGALSSSEQQVNSTSIVIKVLQLTQGCVSLQDMHSVCPTYPWDEQLVSITVETNKKGWVTLNGFLAFWMLVYCLGECISIVIATF